MNIVLENPIEDDVFVIINNTFIRIRNEKLNKVIEQKLKVIRWKVSTFSVNNKLITINHSSKNNLN